METKAKNCCLEGLICDIRQGDVLVTQYYNLLARYWQQLDMLEKIEWKYMEDGVKHRDFFEEKMVIRFLHVLRKELDDVSGKIMSTRPIPKPKSAFCRGKEGRESWEIYDG